jgi:hypothetical protein
MKPISIPLNSDATLTAIDKAAQFFPNLSDKLQRLVDEAEKRAVESQANSELSNGLRKQSADLALQIGLMIRDNEDGRPVERMRLASLQKQQERVDAKRKSLEAPKAPKLTPEERRREEARVELDGGQNPAEFAASQGPLANFESAPAELPSGDLKKARAKLEDKKLPEILSSFIANRADKVDEASALAKARADHAAMVKLGAPNVEQTTTYRRRGFERRPTVGEIEWPTKTAFSFDLNKSITTQNGVAFACWLDPEGTWARIEAEIRALYTDGGGTAPANRDDYENELRAEWLATQRVLVRICEELGEPIPEVHALAYFEVERAASKPRPDKSLVLEGVNAPLPAGVPIGNVPSLAEQGVANIRSGRYRK